MLRETNRRERDARRAPGDLRRLRPGGTLRGSNPGAGASDVANAAPALRRLREAEGEAAAAANASASPSRRRFRPPIETTSARGSVEGLGSRVGRVAVARLCKSMLVAGACGDPRCARRTTRPRRSSRRRSRARAAARAARRRGHATSTRTTRTRSRRRRGSGSAIASSRIGSWRRSASRAPTRARPPDSSSNARDEGEEGGAFAVGDVAAAARDARARAPRPPRPLRDKVDPRQVRSSPRVMRETRGLRKGRRAAERAPPRGDGGGARRRFETSRETRPRRLENHQARPKKHRRRRGGRSERRRGRGGGRRFGRRFEGASRKALRKAARKAASGVGFLRRNWRPVGPLLQTRRGLVLGRPSPRRRALDRRASGVRRPRRHAPRPGDGADRGLLPAVREALRRRPVLRVPGAVPGAGRRSRRRRRRRRGGGSRGSRVRRIRARTSRRNTRTRRSRTSRSREGTASCTERSARGGRSRGRTRADEGRVNFVVDTSLVYDYKPRVSPRRPRGEAAGRGWGGGGGRGRGRRSFACGFPEAPLTHRRPARIPERSRDLILPRRPPPGKARAPPPPDYRRVLSKRASPPASFTATNSLTGLPSGSHATPSASALNPRVSPNHPLSSPGSRRSLARFGLPTAVFSAPLAKWNQHTAAEAGRSAGRRQQRAPSASTAPRSPRGRGHPAAGEYSRVRSSPRGSRRCSDSNPRRGAARLKPIGELRVRRLGGRARKSPAGAILERSSRRVRTKGPRRGSPPAPRTAPSTSRRVEGDDAPPAPSRPHRVAPGAAAEIDAHGPRDRGRFRDRRRRRRRRPRTGTGPGAGERALRAPLSRHLALEPREPPRDHVRGFPQVRAVDLRCAPARPRIGEPASANRSRSRGSLRNARTFHAFGRPLISAKNTAAWSASLGTDAPGSARTTTIAGSAGELVQAPAQVRGGCSPSRRRPTRTRRRCAGPGRAARPPRRGRRRRRHRTRRGPRPRPASRPRARRRTRRRRAPCAGRAL